MWLTFLQSILRSSAVTRSRPVRVPARIDGLYDLPVDRVAQQFFLIGALLFFELVWYLLANYRCQIKRASAIFISASF
jgi:hypothetical protein